MKLSSYLILAGFSLLASCKKIELTGGTPDFQVTTTGTTFKVGENVKFTITGNPGLISFYSGEVYREYVFKDGRIVTAGPLNLSFTSAVTGGTQSNQLSVLASTDFDGNYTDLSRIQAATWSNITSRFALGTTATFLASGVNDISDLRVPGKPLYIAYKYLTNPQTVGGVARSWMIQAFSFTSTTALGSLTIGDLSNSGFQIIQQIKDTSTTPRSSLTASRLTLLGNTFSTGNDPQHEIWGISKRFNPSEIDIGPDRPVPVKGNSDAKVESFTYKFTKAGTYKVTFVGANINVNDSREVIQQLEITIIP